MPFRPNKDREYGSTADVVSRLFKECGGVPEVMKILELSRTRAYALADPHDKAEISFDRVLQLTAATGATTAAEHLALAAGGAFTMLEQLDEKDWHQLASFSAQESASLLGLVLESLSPANTTPGEIDHHEAKEILERVERVMGLLATKHALLRKILEVHDAR